MEQKGTQQVSQDRLDPRGQRAPLAPLGLQGTESQDSLVTLAHKAHRGSLEWANQGSQVYPESQAA